MKRIGLCLGLSCISLPSFAAIDITDNLSISGFGSTSWTRSDNETRLLTNREIINENCFDCDTTFGLQLDFFYDNFKASTQVVKRPQDDWSDPQLEWAYLGYNINDIEFRAGRLRLPIFLISEYFYVGHAYTSARPPTEVYNSLLGITAFNGISASWDHELSDDYTLGITPYVGFKNSSEVNYSSLTQLKFETKDMLGVNLLLSAYNYRVNFAYMKATFDQKLRMRGTSTPYQLVSENDKIELFALGGEYDFEQASVKFEAQTSDYFSSWYTQGSYNLNKFTPYAIWGQNFDEDKEKTSDSYTLGVRYDLISNVSLNAEWQYFDTQPNKNGEFIDRPDQANTNAHLYTVMLSFVF